MSDLFKEFGEYPVSGGNPGRMPKGQHKIEKVMHEYKAGTLKSGSGQKVTSRKQAVAIAISEAREAGAKIPKKRKK